eukprot:352338-Chlamydomonas_euryale.AAC.5
MPPGKVTTMMPRREAADLLHSCYQLGPAYLGRAPSMAACLGEIGCVPQAFQTAPASDVLYIARLQVYGDLIAPSET